MQGRRVYIEDDVFTDTQPGDYWYWSDGKKWMCNTPNGHLGALGKHQITEHEDGTITVSPSILVSTAQGGELWHGYLERGVWREV